MKSFNDLTVIIPTLNERENITSLITGLLRSYKGIHIIVADGGSKDGTLNAVKNIRKRHDAIVIAPHKRGMVRGITSDVLNGLKLVKTSKTIIMDGDLQHPVNKVGKISEKLDKHDMVIAVRVSIRNWGLYRRLVSKCVTLFTLAVFDVKRYRTCGDMMSGFFGVRTGLFKELSTSNRSRYVLPGYKVMLDTLKLMGTDARIAEVKYSTFHKRKHGTSKANTKVLINIIRTCFR